MWERVHRPTTSGQTIVDYISPINSSVEAFSKRGRPKFTTLVTYLRFSNAKFMASSGPLWNPKHWHDAMRRVFVKPCPVHAVGLWNPAPATPPSIIYTFAIPSRPVPASAPYARTKTLSKNRLRTTGNQTNNGKVGVGKDWWRRSLLNK